MQLRFTGTLRHGSFQQILYLEQHIEIVIHRNIITGYHHLHRGIKSALFFQIHPFLRQNSKLFTYQIQLFPSITSGEIAPSCPAITIPLLGVKLPAVVAIVEMQLHYLETPSAIHLVLLQRTILQCPVPHVPINILDISANE